MDNQSFFTEVSEKSVLKGIQSLSEKQPERRVLPMRIFSEVLKSYTDNHKVVKMTELSRKIADILDELHVITVGNLTTMIELQSSEIFSKCNKVLLEYRDLDKKDDRKSFMIDLDRYGEVENKGKALNGQKLQLDFNNLSKPVPFITYNELFKKVQKLQGDNNNGV